MATVTEVLDALRSGKMTVAQVEADFRSRRWAPSRPKATAAEAWLGAEAPPPDPNSWDAVNEYPGIDQSTYKRLAAAHTAALAK